MKIMLMITGDLCNGYRAKRPIMLQAKMVSERHEVFWLVTDPLFSQYGYHPEFRLAVAECLADMADMLELCEQSGSKSQVKDLKKYLKRSKNYALYHPVKPE